MVRKSKGGKLTLVVHKKAIKVISAVIKTNEFEGEVHHT